MSALKCKECGLINFASAETLSDADSLSVASLIRRMISDHIHLTEFGKMRVC